MSFRNKYIKIIDWVGNELLNAEYDSKEVDVCLEANYCECRELNESLRSEGGDFCSNCDHTGYTGDFEVLWEDESDKDGCNVYEYINY